MESQPRNEADQVVDEMDSYMFQTIGHNVVSAIAEECLEVPFFRQATRARALETSLEYSPTDGDEVEDMYELLKRVVEADPTIQGVASGAVLSTYQRVRVEHVCSRLGLTSLGYLWQRSQPELLAEMIDTGVHAILVKTAGMGLNPHKHLGKSIAELQPYLMHLGETYGCHVCGEGGEYETFTLDCPLFRKRIVVDKFALTGDLETDVAPVAHYRIEEFHVEDKSPEMMAAQRQQWQAHWTDPVPPLASPFTVDRDGDEELRSDDDYVSDFLSSLSPLPELEVLPDAPASHVLALSPDTELSAAPNTARGSVVLVPAAVPTTHEAETREDMLRAAMRAEFDRVGAALAPLSWSDVFYCKLFIADMNDYLVLNSIYKSMFEQRPPSRLAVQVSADQLAGGVVSMACLASPKPRKVLHVQSTSQWAPCNIGPYSQASVLGGEIIFLAGQIALDPPTMTMAYADNVRLQALQCARHAGKVLEVEGGDLSTSLSATVFCTPGAAGETAEALGWAGEEHNRRGWLTATSALYVEVECLPRDANVELQLIGMAKAKHDELELDRVFGSSSADGFTIASHSVSSTGTVLAASFTCTATSSAPRTEQLANCIVEQTRQALADASLSPTTVVSVTVFLAALDNWAAAAAELQAQLASAAITASVVPVSSVRLHHVSERTSAALAGVQVFATSRC